MSRPSLIDALEFARLGQVLEGRLPVAGFSRLGSALYDRAGDLRYRLHGSVDARGNSALELEFETNVRVVCQRCLEPLELPLQVKNRLRLLDAVPAWTADAAEIDADADDEIVVGESLDVEALLEDEVLLSLPWAPRHDNCNLAHGQGARHDAGRESPFGVLARLKHRAAK